MTEVGNVYGEALYDLAKAEALSKIIGEQLHILQQSFQQEPDFIRLLSSPNLSKAERCRILDDSFRGKVHTYVLNFLKILTEMGVCRVDGPLDGYYIFEVDFNAPKTTIEASPLLQRLRRQLAAGEA